MSTQSLLNVSVLENTKQKGGVRTNTLGGQERIWLGKSSGLPPPKEQAFASAIVGLQELLAYE